MVSLTENVEAAAEIAPGLLGEVLPRNK